MKKSSQVPAALIVAIAASLGSAGCGSGQQCVDSQGRVLPDIACSSGGGGYGYVRPHYIRTGGFGSSGSGFFGG